jgi:hypothetical protein
MPLLMRAASVDDRLAADFINPPAATQPRCYWYWMKGQISKDGLTKDLEAMKRVGIGEAYIGIIEGGATKALTEEWWSMIDHAVREGTRIGVDIGLFNCPGWSQSGGPWVKPEQSMRYIVQSEKRVQGPSSFAEKLPAHPKAVQELAVLAFPAPPQDTETAQAQGAVITRAPKEIKFAMPKPFIARSLMIQPAKKIDVTATLQVSDDGVAYRTVRTFPVNRTNLKVQVGPVPLAAIYIAFPPTPAAFFRVIFNKDCEPGELTLSAAPRLEGLAEKSLIKMFQEPRPPFDYYRWAPQAEAEATALAINPASVVNLSAKLAADGTLNWQVPPGDWIIVRSGLAPTGVKNTPAPPEATGLEVDKMNRTALKTHFDAYVGKLLARIPAAQRTAWKHVVADSYEVGSQNWTDALQVDFQKRYGYDPLVFLPVMSGRIVGSPAQSDRFLWDLRRLIADRISTEYVGGLRELCNANGLKMWLENYGHWGFPGEFLQYGGNCDEISGEFLAGGTLGPELRPASSAAHIYGKKQVFAEAFTGGPRFTSTPWSLKKRGDWAYSQGINQFVLHVYIHQPWDDRLPGVNTWFGTEFNRNNTWFEASKSWIDYNRRCSVLLQQGQPVADVAYFIGEDAPRAFGGSNPELPPGYDFDYINAEVLLTRATAKDGRLVLASGMSYKLLVLPAQDTMTPELLAKIAELAKAGVAVCGPRPVNSPSLKNYPACDQRVATLAAELWDKGLISPSGDLKAILTKIQTPPDLDGVDYSKILFTHRRTDDKDIYFLSNQTDAPVDLTPIFRVTGRAPELWNADSGTREKLALYEIGATATKVPLRLEAGGSVFVVFRGQAASDCLVGVKRDGQPYFLGGSDVVRSEDGKLVVQTHQPGRYEFTTAQGKTQVTTVLTPAAPQAIETGWQVTFPGLATPVPFSKLASWTKHTDAAVKYFSGTATYRTSFDAPAVKTGERLTLDLGQVESLAEVTLNGRKFQWLWQPPYRLDITESLKPGANALEVRVVNTWHNRLSGEKHEPTAFTAPGVFKPWLAEDYKPTDDLKPAGLLGPVQVLTTQTAVVNN